LKSKKRPLARGNTDRLVTVHSDQDVVAVNRFARMTAHDRALVRDVIHSIEKAPKLRTLRKGGR